MRSTSNDEIKKDLDETWMEDVIWSDQRRLETLRHFLLERLVQQNRETRFLSESALRVAAIF